MPLKHSIFFALSLLLAGCTTAEVQRSINLARGAANFKSMNTAQQVRFIASQDATLAQYVDIERLFQKKLAEFIAEATREWGDKPKQATRKKYVKYTQHYKSRAEVDFESRSVTVETVDTEAPIKSLKEAIATTLLTPFDPTQVDLHSAAEVKLGGEPFLYRQVLDNEGKPIRWRWRADRYAEHLIGQALREKRIGGKRVRYVTFAMEPASLNTQAGTYRADIMEQAKRYGISPSLIYAVIEVESSFNPYAVSAVPAYGLMQIVPKTAGRDTWKFLHGNDRVPTASYLYDPQKNIEMGTAYLHIINTRYLAAIRHPLTREYCMVAAYNTGSGNVLKTFHGSDRDKAADIINAMEPEAVFDKLRRDLPYDETRRYVQKVREAKRRYI